MTMDYLFRHYVSLSMSLTVVARSVGYELVGPSENPAQKTRWKKPYGLLPRVGDCKIRRDVEIGELP